MAHLEGVFNRDSLDEEPDVFSACWKHSAIHGPWGRISTLYYYLTSPPVAAIPSFIGAASQYISYLP